MPLVSRPVRIFFSHPFRKDYVDNLIDILRRAGWVEGLHYVFVNPTVERKLPTGYDAFATMALLVPLIQGADVFWQIGSLDASHRDFMEWESVTAKAGGKPALAIRPRDQERMSLVATADGDRDVVEWNGAAIISATKAKLDKVPKRKLGEFSPGQLAAAMVVNAYGGKLGSPRSTVLTGGPPIIPALPSTIEARVTSAAPSRRVLGAMPRK